MDFPPNFRLRRRNISSCFVFKASTANFLPILLNVSSANFSLLECMHVDRLKLLRGPLPLAEPFSNIWLKIRKVIDDLHIKNHKEPCPTVYSPSIVKESFPEANLMTCEQTFAWLGRFRKVLNSTPKTHYHFLLHRLVITRNRYTELCYAEGKRPLLPSAKFQTPDS